jgi:hypothetical protein
MRNGKIFVAWKSQILEFVWNRKFSSLRVSLCSRNMAPSFATITAGISHTRRMSLRHSQDNYGPESYVS